MKYWPIYYHNLNLKHDILVVFNKLFCYGFGLMTISFGIPSRLIFVECRQAVLVRAGSAALMQ